MAINPGPLLSPRSCLIHLFTSRLQSGRYDCRTSWLLILSFSLSFSLFLDLASDPAKNGIREGTHTHASPTHKIRKTTAAYLKLFWGSLTFSSLFFPPENILGFEQEFAFCGSDLKFCLLRLYVVAGKATS